MMGGCLAFSLSKMEHEELVKMRKKIMEMFRQPREKRRSVRGRLEASQGEAWKAFASFPPPS
jgi:hypothetical protein